MVYSSAPLYLDQHNWHHHQQQGQFHQQQQQNQQPSVVTHGSGGGGENPHHHQIAVHTPPPAPSQAVGGGSSSSIRPGSMADRARQAKIPQPEQDLKCPRCESTNTKFCYFNNYSLTQPRHFCKMCRRYWTRGGALRSVPVGGGCRRNKRSGKSGGVSKSSCSGERQTGTGPCNNSTSPISSNSNNTEMNNNNSSHGSMLDTSLPSQGFGTRLTQFPLLASLHGLTQGQYGSQASNLGLNFGEMMNTTVQGELGFQIGPSSGRSSDLWRPHHFPNFLAGFDPSQQVPHPPPSSSLYQFPIDHQGMDQAANNQVPSRSSFISAMSEQSVRSSMLSNNSAGHKNNEAAAVKAEGVNQGGTNLLSSSFLGMPENSQYWVGNNNNNNSNSTWTDLSSLNSSTNNLK